MNKWMNPGMKKRRQEGREGERKEGRTEGIL